MTSAQQTLLSKVFILLQLILIMPATNATSERSFIALCHVKTYLRSTMTQTRLNNFMLFHVHKDMTTALDLTAVANGFIGDSEHGLKLFGTL